MKPHWYTHWVERLRTQPAPVKSQVALIGAGTLTAVIALVWLTTLPARITSLSGAGSSVRANVSESLEEAPLVQDAFSVPDEAEEPVEPAGPSEEEMLRNRIDALVGDISRERATRTDKGTTTRGSEDSGRTTPEPVRSTVGAPVLIETR